MLGARGVEKVFEVDLAPDEKAMLEASVRLCSESIAEARKLLVPEPVEAA
jgi:malate/lactate dehydrogenase